MIITNNSDEVSWQSVDMVSWLGTTSPRFSIEERLLSKYDPYTIPVYGPPERRILTTKDSVCPHSKIIIGFTNRIFQNKIIIT